jgi:choline transporter-like protein 2/4/5
LFFFDLSKCADPLVAIEGCPTPQVCIEKCPSERFFHTNQQCNSEGATVYRKKLICTREVDVSTLTTCSGIDQLVKDKKCAEWYLESEARKSSKEFLKSHFFITHLYCTHFVFLI